MFKNFKIKYKLLIGYLILILNALLIGGYFTYRLVKVDLFIEQEIAPAVKNLSDVSLARDLAQSILYYDEILTQSARNYAFTQDKKWKDRYYDFVDELGRMIEKSMESSVPEDKQFFSEIDQANAALVEMEETAIGLVDLGKPSEAVEILESNEYSRQKEIYAKGLSDYFSAKSDEYQQILARSNDFIEGPLTETRQLIFKNIAIFIIVMIIGSLFGFSVSLILAAIITRPLIKLQRSVEKIKKGNFAEKALIDSRDEIGKLANSFNDMVDTLEKSNMNIEKKIQERTSELEKVNKYMTGRELRMLELKKEIEKLKAKK